MRSPLILSLAIPSLAQFETNSYDAAALSSVIADYAGGIESEGFNSLAASYLADQLIAQTSGPIANAFDFLNTAHGVIPPNTAINTAPSGLLGIYATALASLPASDRPAFSSLIDEVASLQGVTEPAVAAGTTSVSAASGRSTAVVSAQSSGSVAASSTLGSMATAVSASQTGSSSASGSTASATQTSGASSNRVLSFAARVFSVAMAITVVLAVAP